MISKTLAFKRQHLALMKLTPLKVLTLSIYSFAPPFFIAQTNLIFVAVEFNLGPLFLFQIYFFSN